MLDKAWPVRQKLGQLEAEIERLKAAEFHHLGVRQCLLDIESVVSADLWALNRADEETDDKKVTDLLGIINSNISRLHHVLGIILRSTNPRNSFEIFDPLLRLTRELLGPQAMLILSSEWDFSPFAEPHVLKEYPSFAFVGLPVMESGNSLVVPLAGHELGHAVWRSEDGEVNEQLAMLRSAILLAMEEALLSSITDLRRRRQRITENGVRKGLRQAWGRFARGVTERLCEEIFCDFLGVRIFGNSYLYAFLYLTSPHVGPTDLASYPRRQDRATYMVWMRRRLRLGETRPGLNRPAAFSHWFSEPGVPRAGEEAYPNYLPLEEFLLRQSHNVVRRLLPDIERMALWACQRNDGIPMPTRDCAENIFQCFRHGVPGAVVRQRGMADIINAGWMALMDPALWSHKEEWRKRRSHFISELVFKSLDVLEFKERTQYSRRSVDAPEVR